MANDKPVFHYESLDDLRKNLRIDNSPLSELFKKAHETHRIIDLFRPAEEIAFIETRAGVAKLIVSRSGLAEWAWVLGIVTSSDFAMPRRYGTETTREAACLAAYNAAKELAETTSEETTDDR